MKKLLYAAIVAFLFIGGLAAGVVHKQMNAQKEPGTGDAAAPTEATGLSLADLGAGTPTETVQNSETLNLTESSPTAIAAAPTPEETLASDGGRSFGSGASEPVTNSGSSRASSGSSGSSGSSMSASTWSEPAPVATKKPRKDSTDSFSSSASIPSNTEYTGGTVIEDTPVPIEPVATPRSKGGKGTKAVAVATPDAVEEMPTVDDGADPFAAADTAPRESDPFAAGGSTAMTAPATPDPFAAATPAPMVAMAMPSGGGDLVFGASSGKGAALKKVAQKQNGSSSVVMIELAGSARYKIIQIPKKRQVWIDFEGTEVPGGGSSVGGSAAHVREISAKFFANENGGSSIARIIVQLDDGVVQMNEKGKEELAVTPNRGTGEASKLTLTIGAKSQQF